MTLSRFKDTCTIKDIARTALTKSTHSAEFHYRNAEKAHNQNCFHVYKNQVKKADYWLKISEKISRQWEIK